MAGVNSATVCSHGSKAAPLFFYPHSSLPSNHTSISFAIKRNSLGNVTTTLNRVLLLTHRSPPLTSLRRRSSPVAALDSDVPHPLHHQQSNGLLKPNSAYHPQQYADSATTRKT